MSNSTNQQVGDSNVAAVTIDSVRISLASSSSLEGSRDPQARASSVPQIAFQPAIDQGSDDEISPFAHSPPTRRAPLPPLPSPQFLQVPRPSRTPSRHIGPQDGSPSQHHPELSLRSIPQSQTGPLHPLRMHPTRLTSSTTMPVTPAIGRPETRLGDDSRPRPMPASVYPIHAAGARPITAPTHPMDADEVKQKIDKMLAASAALKPEVETAAPEEPCFARRLLRKISTPNFPGRLFSKNKSKDAAPKPHEIRHITGGLAPLPLSEHAEQASDAQLRSNETGNLKREKALKVLGDAPRPVPTASPADPFSAPPRSTRPPTEFESSLRANPADSPAPRTPLTNPFRAEHVLTSALDSFLPGPPEASSTPPRTTRIISPSPPGFLAAAADDESPTKPSRSFPLRDASHPGALTRGRAFPSPDATRHGQARPSAPATAVPSRSGLVLLPPPPPHPVSARRRVHEALARKRHPAPGKGDLERLERELGELLSFPSRGGALGEGGRGLLASSRGVEGSGASRAAGGGGSGGSGVGAGGSLLWGRGGTVGGGAGLGSVGEGGDREETPGACGEGGPGPRAESRGEQEIGGDEVGGEEVGGGSRPPPGFF